MRTTLVRLLILAAGLGVGLLLAGNQCTLMRAYGLFMVIADGSYQFAPDQSHQPGPAVRRLLSRRALGTVPRSAGVCSVKTRRVCAIRDRRRADRRHGPGTR